MADFPFVPNTTNYQPANAIALGKAAKLAYEKNKQNMKREVNSWGFSKF